MMAKGRGGGERLGKGGGRGHTRSFPVEIEGKENREERRQLDQ